MPVVRHSELPAYVHETVNEIEHLHNDLAVLFRGCRWGLDASGRLCFDQIRQQPNTSTEPGWHYGPARRLADLIGATVEISDTEIVFVPTEHTVKREKSRATK